MTVKLEREGKLIDLDRVIVFIDGTQYRISANNQNELVVNKFNDDDNSICVRPSVSNEIRIS